MLKLIRPSYSLFSSSMASFYYLYYISPRQASSLRLVWCQYRGPLPPSRVKSCIVYRVGGWENRFQVQYSVYSRIRSVQYLQLLLYSSMVPVRVGIHRHISIKFYWFGWQYNTSNRVIQVPQANQHRVYQFIQQQYGVSDGLSYRHISTRLVNSGSSII